MPITINKTKTIVQDDSQQWIFITVNVDGDNCKFTHVAPSDLEGDDLQDYVDSREDFYKTEILRNKYADADCYNSSLKEWETWIENGKVNKSEEAVPDMSWLKADIQAYMDTHSIAYSAGDSKSELLTKIEEA